MRQDPDDIEAQTKSLDNTTSLDLAAKTLSLDLAAGTRGSRSQLAEGVPRGTPGASSQSEGVPRASAAEGVPRASASFESEGVSRGSAAMVTASPPGPVAAAATAAASSPGPACVAAEAMAAAELWRRLDHSVRIRVTNIVSSSQTLKENPVPVSTSPSETPSPLSETAKGDTAPVPPSELPEVDSDRDVLKKHQRAHAEEATAPLCSDPANVAVCVCVCVCV